MFSSCIVLQKKTFSLHQYHQSVASFLSFSALFQKSVHDRNVITFLIDVIALPNPDVASTKAQFWRRISGWWGQPTPLKNMNVSWDDYPQYMGI